MHISAKHRRQAMNVAAQLPDNPRDALCILAAAREIVLHAARMDVPADRLKAEPA
jgi:hypothetical protein